MKNDGGILGDPEHLGNLNTLFERRANHHELVPTIGRDVVSAWIAAQHHRTPSSSSVTLHRAIERPDLARCAAGHLEKILDHDAVETAFSADERGQPPHHFVGLEFLHLAYSLNEYHENSRLRTPSDHFA